MSLPVPKQAMVLAAGKGLRMRPLTDHLPKPLIEVAGRSLIDRAIDQLEAGGVERVVVNSCYLAQILEDHLRRRASPQLVFSREDEALETGGGIRLALPYFGGEPFYALNGDFIWRDGKGGTALARLADAWRDDLDAVLLVQETARAVGYDGAGDFFIGDAGRLTRRGAAASAPYIYAGIQLLHPRLFVNAPDGAFSMNVLWNRIMQMPTPRIRAVVHDGIWLHVGDPDGLRQAEGLLVS